MGRPILGLAVVLALSACASEHHHYAELSMEPRRPDVSEHYVAHRLGNGLRVILIPDARTNLAYVGVTYQVGSADDPPGASGLAHYAEHVVHNAAYGGNGAALRGFALEENAHTLADRTYFHATALGSDLDRMLEVAARRMEVGCASAVGLDEAMLARERDVVIAEHKLRKNVVDNATLAAIWGAGHPYARAPGAIEFISAPRELLCDLIARRYGPSSATLVIAGGIPDDTLTRVRARFDRIAARASGLRPPDPSPPPALTRAVVPGLSLPTAVIVVPLPPEGSAADGAVALLDSISIPVDGDFRFNDVDAIVLGGRHGRVLVASASDHDAARIEALAASIRRRLDQATFPSLEPLRQRKLAAELERLDDTFDAARAVAPIYDPMQLSRFRLVNQLEAVTVSTLHALIASASPRTVLLLPEVGGAARADLRELATSMHFVERDDGVAIPDDPGAALPPTRARPIETYKLRNGLTVWLAHDPWSLAFDARLVIATPPPRGQDASIAARARLLAPDDGTRFGADAAERIDFYKRIGSSVVPAADSTSTMFSVSGAALYADWHAWYLAWTVLHGDYPPGIDRPMAIPRSVEAIVQRIVTGAPTDASVMRAPVRADLEAYRRAHYRPDRATLIVTGAFDPSQMRREIEQLFGEWRAERRGDRGAAPSPQPPDALPAGEHVAIESPTATTVDLVFGFPLAGIAPSASTDVWLAERANLAVLAELLDMRARRLRDTLGVSYDPGVTVRSDGLYIACHVEPAYIGAAARALAAILAELRAPTDALTADFIRAKKRVLARALARPVGTTFRARSLAVLAAAGRTPDEGDRGPDAIRAVELADIGRLAQRTFAPAHVTVVAQGRAADLDVLFSALRVPRALVRRLGTR